MKFLCMAIIGVLFAAGSSQAAGGGAPSMEKFAKVSMVVGEKCMACHTRGYDLPFYAKVPGIREIIEQDYKDGLRAMDLNAELMQKPGNA